MKILHADVFSQKPYSGNGLTVILPDKELNQETMQRMAREFKQFETIFLYKQSERIYNARIFTMEEELNFAGHPILGACAVIHKEFFSSDKDITITFELNCKTVVTQSSKRDDHYEVTMNQGIPTWVSDVAESWWPQYCEALNLTTDDLATDFPMEVVSTGLSYLLIPLRRNLDKAKILDKNFEALLQQNGAKFVYLFDMNALEGRTWDPVGYVEDVATGSAAGPIGAYLYKHNVFKTDETIYLNQGQFVGRPSILIVSTNSIGEMIVSGQVTILAKGELFE